MYKKNFFKTKNFKKKQQKKKPQYANEHPEEKALGLFQPYLTQAVPSQHISEAKSLQNRLLPPSQVLHTL